MQSKLEVATIFEEKALSEFMAFIEEEFGLELAWYNSTSLERRLDKVRRHFKLGSLKNLQMLLLRDKRTFQTFVDLFTVQVTELFREPLTLQEIRRTILPMYQKKEQFKVLLVGSSTGEELSSINIILEEENIRAKSEIWATDLSQNALKKAHRPSISKSRIREATMNYRKSGGRSSLDNYYQSTSSLCYFHEGLFNNVRFQTFDVTRDELGQKFDLILCRNLLIYFQVEHQDRILTRLLNHLNPGGFIALGEQEALSFYHNRESLQIVSSSQKIFRQSLIAP